MPSLERIEEQLEAIDQRVALVVLPSLKDVRRRLHKLTVRVWCEVAALIAAIGLAATILWVVR